MIASDAVAVISAPAEPAAKPSLPALLQQCVTEFKNGEFCHRKHLLQAGRLAQEYLLAARAQGQPRAVAIRMIEHELTMIAGIHVSANRLIGASAVFLLLGDGTAAAEDVPAGVLRELIPLLKRDRSTEAWAIRPGLEKAARELFARAMAEHLQAPTVALAVRVLLGKGQRDEAEEERNPLAHLRDDPHAAAAAIADVIARNADPVAVIAELGKTLDWCPAMGTALARALLQAGAYKTANALLLALKAESEGGVR